MGAYVCPSCGIPLDYVEKELLSLPNHKGIMGNCPNQDKCGIEYVNIIVNVNTENK